MRARSLLSLLSLGTVLSAAAATGAAAQPGGRLLVCRDGTEVVARDAGVCAGRGGVNGRATEIARRNAPLNNGGYNGYGDNRTYDPRYEARSNEFEYRRRREAELEAARAAERARAQQRYEARREAAWRDAERRNEWRERRHGY